jgi:hypothetical protein
MKTKSLKSVKNQSSKPKPKLYQIKKIPWIGIKGSIKLNENKL